MNLYLVKWASSTVVYKDYTRIAESLEAAGEGLIAPTVPSWHEAPTLTVELLANDVDPGLYGVDVA